MPSPGFQPQIEKCLGKDRTKKNWESIKQNNDY